MFEKKNSERNNAGKLMELAQDEGPAQTDSQEFTPLSKSMTLESLRLGSGRL
jgi:hypothetical protein